MAAKLATDEARVTVLVIAANETMSSGKVTKADVKSATECGFCAR